ncbi:MAG: S9 family peptidase [Dysgonamonadaceae bacterium]|nr:S9 family peptidase [Dysgonamonadaceae bacterium]
MKKIYLFLFCVCLSVISSAQTQLLTLEDLIPGGKNYAKFAVKTDYQLRWDGENLVFSNEKETLIADPRKPDIRRPIADKPAPRAQNNRQRGDYCPENKLTALSQKNNLYISDSLGNKTAVAEDENEHIVYGQSVHRNEFGIHKGTFWSPKGNYLAFYRMDETMVGDYPLVDIFAREAELKNIKYPMAGMTSHEVTVGIYCIESGKTVYLKTGEPRDHYLTNIAWDPSEKFLYIAELNREQNFMQLNRYDISSGEKTETLLEERNERYVEPQNPALFLKKNPSQFIWQSRMDGYNHLYLFDLSKNTFRQLTKGSYDVNSIVGFDAAEKYVFIITNELNPIENQVYKVELKSGKKTQLTFEPGVHSPSLSPSGKYFIDRFSNKETPLKIMLVKTDVNAKVKPIVLQTAENPYKDYVLPEITLGSLKAADGKTDLYYHLAKPVNFDPAKKYPVIIYVYGGPHSQMVRNNWLGSLRGWSLYMAQKGYVVFSMDNRGTSNRGFEFESVIHRQLGITETADQMKGVEFLKSLPYVDASRIGVHGWSYGGFMTTNLLLRHPDTFKCGVAGGPVIDWKYYEVMYGERYMDTPEENPDGYRDTNMNNLAGNLKAHFLLIHGDIDPTVVWQNSLSFLNACIKARTYPDYFVYPGHEHNMSGADRVHLHEKITRYFEDYLK